MAPNAPKKDFLHNNTSFYAKMEYTNMLLKDPFLLETSILTKASSSSSAKRNVLSGKTSFFPFLLETSILTKASSSSSLSLAKPSISKVFILSSWKLLFWQKHHLHHHNHQRNLLSGKTSFFYL